MKRLFTLIVLLGLLGIVAGCNKDSSTSTSTDAGTSATNAVTTSTNK